VHHGRQALATRAPLWFSRRTRLLLVILLAMPLPARAAPIVEPAVVIPMRDGAGLAATVVRPEGTTPRGTVLVMTPYDRRTAIALAADPELGLGANFAAEHAWVMVDVRGAFGSRAAQLADPSPDQAGRDGYDAVEWIAGQPWSNGRVAMWGSSALGRVQFDTAVQQPPHLTAIVPMAAPFGYTYDQFYPGGVLRESYVDTLQLIGFVDPVTRAVIASHPSRDATWEMVEATAVPSGVDVPVLLISGWWDLFPAQILRTFDALLTAAGPVARAESRLVIGPWTHAAIGGRLQGDVAFPAATAVSGDEARRFFARWLDGAAAPAPRVRWYEQGADVWHDDAAWPPPGAEPVRLYLAGRRLLPAPARGNRSRRYTYRPRDPSPTVGGGNVVIALAPESVRIGAGPRDQQPEVETRPDVLLYTSDVLIDPIPLRGGASVTLFVTSSRRDTDFAVRLTDVYPDGRSMLVADGIQRARYRDSTSAPELLKRFRSTAMTVRLTPTAYTFVAGHRVRLDVSSSNAPRFAPNPNVPDPGPGVRPRAAVNVVQGGARRTSVLRLPTGSPG
jgi:predicted acyl esterase